MGQSQSQRSTSNLLLALDIDEWSLLDTVLDFLQGINMDSTSLVRSRLSDLDALAAAISRFPPVKENQLLAGVERGPETLAASLRGLTGASRLLHTPTRVVASRSFLVAKTHAFSLVSIVLKDIADTHLDESLRQEATQLRLECRAAIFEIIGSLMVEDVYLSCLEDRTFPYDKKEALAIDLIGLWDRGRDPRATSHVPALKALWAARDLTPPVFGTMEGTSELLSLSIDLDSSWHYFVTNRLPDKETHEALEEFLFGLSREEIIEIRLELSRKKSYAINREGMRSCLGREGIYTPVLGDDPRSMYEFYVERRDEGRIRERSDIAGPRKTVEELYLAFLMAEE